MRLGAVLHGLAEQIIELICPQNHVARESMRNFTCDRIAPSRRIIGGHIRDFPGDNARPGVTQSFARISSSHAGSRSPAAIVVSMSSVMLNSPRSTAPK